MAVPIKRVVAYMDAKEKASAKKPTKKKAKAKTARNKKK